MLSKFDWLRRCATGTELLATLKILSDNPNIEYKNLEQGGPFSACGNLCQRCKVYAPETHSGRLRRLCPFCLAVIRLKKEFIFKSPNTVLIWGNVNQVPRQVKNENSSTFFYGRYVHDENHFLAAIHRRYLREWLQELVIYGGSSLLGLLQIFPSIGKIRHLNMGDYLIWAIHHDSSLPMTQLWIRFFTHPKQLFNPKEQEKLGLLSYSVSEFISMLEMAEIFRAHLHPNEQQKLFELLTLNNHAEEQFYWGRFLGLLSQEAKDMLSSWNIRKWQKQQVQFFYDLINYVILPQSN